MKKNFRKILLTVLSLVLVAAMALMFGACGKDTSKDDTNTPSVNETAKLSFEFEVKDGDNTTVKTIETDKKTVGEALVAEGLISGSQTEYGLMVDTVNGVKYDYNADGKYWAFYINGEYASTGVDSTDIVNGAKYSFVATDA